MKKHWLWLVVIITVLLFSSCGIKEDKSETTTTTAELASEHIHSFGDWEVVIEATCTKDGEEKRTCSECGETESQAIKAFGHVFGEWQDTLPATCTENGTAVRTCNVCGEEETKEVNALGHSFVDATLFAPKTCSVCGETEGDALATPVYEGETYEGELYAFELDSVYYTTVIQETRGSITTPVTGEGFYYVLRLKYTNLAPDEWPPFSDQMLTFGENYKYHGNMGYVYPIVPLDTGFIYVGFEVPKTIETDTSMSLYATFSIGGDLYVYVDRWVEDIEDTTMEPEPALISSGEVYCFEDHHSFVFDKLYYTTEISESKGNTTYYGPYNQGYYLVIRLSFTNLETEPLQHYHSNRFTNIQLTYGDKYEYDGEAYVLVEDIVPLGTQNLYIIFSIPEVIQQDTDLLIATFTVDGIIYTVDCRANGV